MITSSAPVARQPDLRMLRTLTWHGRTTDGRRVSGACGSHVGLRERNEDAFFASTRHCLVTLADGMGGHPGGHVASELAVRSVYSPLVPAGEWVPQGPERHRSRLMAAIIEANRRIRARRPQDPERPMATTLVALWLVDGWAVFGHVGDSRLYRLRDGVLTPLTLDHNALGEALRLGLSAEHVRDLPSHLLSRALGLGDTVRPDVGFCSLQRGDRYLLCTDGLTEELTEGEVCETLARRVSAEQTMRELMQDALLSGSADNITVAVVDVG